MLLHVSVNKPSSGSLLLCFAIVIYLVIYLFFVVALRPNAGHGLLILEVSRSHTTTHHSRQDSSGRVISPSERPLPDNTQHSQQTNIHAPGGIRTYNLSRRAAADLRLRPHGHWDRLYYLNSQLKYVVMKSVRSCGCIFIQSVMENIC